MLARTRWYAKRISVMSAAELAHRIVEQFVLRRLRHTVQAAEPPGFDDIADCHFVSASDACLPTLPVDWQALLAKRESIVAAVGRQGFEVGDDYWSLYLDSAWQRAGAQSNIWPGDFFADIDHREANAIGDIRLAWEPARCQFLLHYVLLCQHAEPALLAHAADSLCRCVDSFYRANPPYVGIHYISAMECALRVIALAHCADLLREQLNAHPERQRFWCQLCDLMAQHATLIRKRLSLYSSAGNHTLCEAVGLLYCALLLPEHACANEWRLTAVSLLEKEGRRQILADGGGIESALDYHRQVTELLVLAELLAGHYQLSLSDELREKIARALSMLASFMRHGELCFTTGDSDSGYSLSPYLDIYHNSELRTDSSPLAPGISLYPESGLGLIRDYGQQHIEMLFNASRLGMPPAFGHGHADALSLNLNINGVPFLTETGTCSYTQQADIRRYLRGTAAHNTVSINGYDQARQLTAFMWTDAPRVRTLQQYQLNASDTLFFSRVSGRSGVRFQHQRWVLYRSQQFIYVLDELRCADACQAALYWHIDDDVVVAGVAEGQRFSSRRQPVSLTVFDSGRQHNTQRYPASDSEPRLCKGVKSDRYGCKREIQTVNYSIALDQQAKFETVIAFNGAQVDGEQCRRLQALVRGYDYAEQS